jgi:hypothetical protein
MTDEQNERTYRISGTSISGGRKTFYASAIEKAREYENFLARHGCDELAIEIRYGAGWRLLEEEMAKTDFKVTVELEATQLAELLAKIAELAERVEALEKQVKND